MNSLPVSSCHLSSAILLGKPLLTNLAWRHCSAELWPRPFRAQNFFFLVCIKFDKGDNSLPKHFESTANIRSNLQISLLSRNQTNTKWRRKVFLQLGWICFQILWWQSENFSDFRKVLSQFAFRNMVVPLPKSQTRHPSRACAPSISHPSFWHDRNCTVQTPPPLRNKLGPGCWKTFRRHFVFVWFHESNEI